MRLTIFFISFILFGIWLNIVFNNYVQIGGYKVNWIFLFMLILTFRNTKILIIFFGILIGLLMDALSHGIMGLYGTSFFLTLLITSQVKKFFFANTFFAISIAVFSMSIFEGWVSLSILGMFEPELEIYSHLIKSTLPLSLLQGFITPIILQLVIWGENIFLGDIA